MDWHDCPTCKKSHPWMPGKRPCPNVNAPSPEPGTAGKPKRKTVGSQRRAHNEPGAPSSRGNGGSTLSVETHQLPRPASVRAAPREPKPGRPLAKDKDKTLKATTPWKTEGISRRTWYRRQKEK